MAEFSSYDIVRITLISTIGAAIIFAPNILAEARIAPYAALCIILAAGALALVQALCYAELARIVPGGGGDATYMKTAFSPALATAYNFFSCCAVIPASCAFGLAQTASALRIAVPLGRYLLVLATLTILFIPARCKDHLFRVFFYLKIAVTAMLAILIGYSWWFADGGCLRSPPAAHRSDWSQIVKAFVNCTFFFSGYNTCNYMQSSAPFAVPYAISVAIVTAVYFLFALGQCAIFSWHQLAHCDTPLLLVEAPLAGLLSPPMLGTVARCIKISVECVMYLGPVLSCHAVFDGIFTGHFSKHRTFSHIVYMLYGLAVYLIIHFETAYSILNATSILMSLFYCLTFVALLRLRRRAEDSLNILVPLAALLVSGATASVDIYDRLRGVFA